MNTPIGAQSTRVQRVEILLVTWKYNEIPSSLESKSNSSVWLALKLIQENVFLKICSSIGPALKPTHKFTKLETGYFFIMRLLKSVCKEQERIALEDQSCNRRKALWKNMPAMLQRTKQKAEKDKTFLGPLTILG